MRKFPIGIQTFSEIREGDLSSTPQALFEGRKKNKALVKRVVYLIGIDFDAAEKNISGFAWEEVGD
ncbi:MAG: hypothetical protein D3910_05885 [Candidatus Electrothrix sp. ATG2]|nr:hypothetical protein [Candidatus Electrothrix sp. ATG2]